MPIFNTGSRGIRAVCVGLILSGTTAPSDRPASLRVERTVFTKTLYLTGELETAQALTITVPRIASKWLFSISKLAEDGQRVQPGDLLLEFDTSDLLLQKLELEKQREEARLKVAQKEAEIESRRQDLLLSLAQAEKALKVARLYAAIDAELLGRAGVQPDGQHAPQHR